MGNDEKTLPPGAVSTGKKLVDPSVSVRSLDGSIRASEEVLTLTNLYPANSEFGNYELVHEIARGGMGVVYKARHKQLDRICALKMILSGQLADQAEIEQFHEEARAAAKLKHVGIVPVHEVGEVNGQHFFSMGFVEGHTLQEEINYRPIPVERAARLAQQLAESISYAHQNSVIHRDLKPANVMLDENGHALVTDFGLAKIQSRATDTGEDKVSMGTPSYMSPEQASGKVELVNELSDVYSIGAILYSMLTGGPPFQSASPLDTMIQVAEKEVIPPSRMNPAISPDIEAITLKCLEKDQSRRYQSAEELAEDLNRFLTGLPITARKLNQHDRWVKWCLREPWLATAVIAMMIFGSCVIATVAINPTLVRVAYDSWATSIVAKGILLGMFISISGFAIFQTVKTLHDRCGRQFGLIRVLTVIPVGFIGVSLVVILLRLILMFFVPDYDLFYGDPEDRNLHETLQEGLDRLNRSSE